MIPIKTVYLKHTVSGEADAVDGKLKIKLTSWTDAENKRVREPGIVGKTYDSIKQPSVDVVKRVREVLGEEPLTTDLQALFFALDVEGLTKTINWNGGSGQRAEFMTALGLPDTVARRGRAPKPKVEGEEKPKRARKSKAEGEQAEKAAKEPKAEKPKRERKPKAEAADNGSDPEAKPKRSRGRPGRPPKPKTIFEAMEDGRWFCAACMSGFDYEGEGMPEECPTGHRNDNPEFSRILGETETPEETPEPTVDFDAPALNAEGEPSSEEDEVFEMLEANDL